MIEEKNVGSYKLGKRIDKKIKNIASIMKRALVLSNTASMIAQFNMNNLRILKELGFHVDVACNYKEGNTCSDDVILNLINDLDEMSIGHYQVDFKRSIGSFSGLKKAYKQVDSLANEHKYDLVFCQSTIGGIVGRLIGRKHQAKVIYIAHGFLFFKGASILRWLTIYPIEWFLSRYTDAIITTNIEDDKLAKKSFKPKGQCLYVPGVGVDLKQFNIDNVNVEELRNSWGLSDSDYLIVSAGELSKRKNHTAVIEAISMINDPNIKYYICGIGEMESEYKALINKFHLNNQVKLLGYQKNLLQIVAMADLFCFPSLSEGLPVSLMIAIALKQNIICSDIRGNNDLILDRKYRFDPMDIDDIKNHIEYAKTNRDQSYIDANYEHLQGFSSERVNEQMKIIFSNFR